MLKTEVKKISDNEYLVIVWITEKVYHAYTMHNAELVALKNQLAAASKN